MLGKLIKGLGRAEPPAAPSPPVVGEASLGRAVRLDPSMLEAVSVALGEPVSPDHVITGQGLAELADDHGTTWLHRFYDDEDRMLQALTASPEGGEALEWSFYVGAGTEHMAVGARRSDWTRRLSSAELRHDGHAFARAWYEGDERDQPPVRLVETVFERADRSDARDLVQDCMVYARDAPQGELLLLAIVLGEGEEAVFERLLGTGLRPHQVGV